jgi:hypothetical protein
MAMQSEGRSYTDSASRLIRSDLYLCNNEINLEVYICFNQSEIKAPGGKSKVKSKAIPITGPGGL